MKNEEWRDVPGYDGLYQVSNKGRIKSFQRQATRFIKQGINSRGYNTVFLHKNGKGKSYSVHRLVATAFLSTDTNKHFVNHIDGNKQNNCIKNLEWCTAKENCLHAHEILMKNVRCVLCVETGVKYSSACSAARALSCDRRTIQKICMGKGRSRTCGGFHWRFA